MKNSTFNRRKFIRNIAATTAGFAALPALPHEVFASVKDITPASQREPAGYSGPPRLKFGVIGISHGHINGMTEAIIRGGGEFVAFHSDEPALAAVFGKKYTQAKQVSNEKEILEDKSIQLVLSSIIPSERGPLGVRVMEHGKDYLVDKPGITSLEQLDLVKKTQKKTGRIFSIMYSERFENRATVKAGELVKAGAIGKVIQTIGMGPHKMDAPTRPAWFFDKKRFGGIICDIGSHQFDQFLFFTGSTTGEIIASQVRNVNHTQYAGFEDFGDVMLRGNGGSGYIRVDWFTPNGLKSWGDGRLTILGTDGYIEVRKNIDISGPDTAGNHLFIVDQKETKYIDCSKEPLPFGELLVNDILNRTETAMTQEHCFLATELALKAQKNAQLIKI